MRIRMMLTLSAYPRLDRLPAWPSGGAAVAGLEPTAAKEAVFYGLAIQHPPNPCRKIVDRPVLLRHGEPSAIPEQWGAMWVLA